MGEHRLSRLFAPGRDGQNKSCDAALAFGASLESEGTPVRFGDLTAQDEADATAAGLRREKRHKEIGRIRDAWTRVLDAEFKLRPVFFPADPHDGWPAPKFQHRIDRV